MAKTENTTKPEEREKLTLQQKFVKLREAIPAISKKQHSDAVKYKYIRIDDIYEYLTPAMNEWGVNFDIIDENATRHYENGDDMYFSSYTQQTRNGERVVWLYEADIDIRWTNADDPADYQDVRLHALGTNDSSADKAKGSALTYTLKYYFFEKFGIDQGLDDPDNTDHSSDVAPAAYNRPNGQQNGNGAQQSAGLSEAQLTRMYKKGEAVQISKEAINDWIAQKYGKEKPETMTRKEYDEVCKRLDERKAKEDQQHAE